MSAVDLSLSPSKLFDVDGMVVVITGGGTGLGLMMATALEHNGATVYIVGRRSDILEKAAKEHNKFGKIIPIEGNITDRASLLAITDVVRARHGYIDLLVNNAGIARNLYPHPLPSPEDDIDGRQPMSPPASPISESSEPSIKAFQDVLWDTGSVEEFAETFATNVTAVYYTTIAFLDLLHEGNLRRQRLAMANPIDANHHLRPPYHTSQVLSVSSSGSFRLDSRVLSPSYTLSKGACTQLGKLLANLLSPWGIRSNVLAPGVWPTDMTIRPTPGFALDPFALADAVPLRRAGTQEDMAGTILFLASRAGAYVNGAVWLVDGGRVGTVASSY
ncbi:hypothetical protein HYPSUDRAFT_146456 [Hypholoma sublateritium FD-334 SS-4]|uniref:NAD(P)-binding protein n=1 Tax=Hypholoma sublateritium (strain FD-334 SS-4) TaxID=945553 RepID=A0A0D2NLE3_HYPSF|nr:hypothetical protein HYPSUDRAFT_146456 [Hypholoma sublateritium FD-334 SS-4]